MKSQHGLNSSLISSLKSKQVSVRGKMEWSEQVQEQLAAATAWNYLPGSSSYAEPAAYTALALIAADRSEAALPAADWLRSIQTPDGSVGVSAEQHEPQWPTALAISTWTQWQRVANDERFQENIDRAIAWTLSHQGKTMPRHEGMGHDTTLRGWSWALDTHSWLEPTAMFLAALILAGKREHPRTAEALRLILDRQLPQGGFNYGNTFVLGQRLLSHVQPTGLALWSLGLAGVDGARVQHSLDYLQRYCKDVKSTVSLCFAAIGLTAFEQPTDFLADKLTQGFETSMRDQRIYRLALLSLATTPLTHPFIGESQHAL